MSFDDISPPNQPFNCAFRPFSLHWEEKEKETVFTVIYGFGEYQFSANVSKHDFREDFSRLLQALQAGEKITAVIKFQGQEEIILLQIRGAGELLFFSWLEEKAGEQTLLLEGETSRQYLLSLNTL